MERSGIQEFKLTLSKLLEREVHHKIDSSNFGSDYTCFRRLTRYAGTQQTTKPVSLGA